MKFKIVFIFIFIFIIIIACAEIKNTARQSKDAVECKLECSRLYRECRDKAGDNMDALALCNEQNEQCVAACEQ